MQRQGATGVAIGMGGVPPGLAAIAGELAPRGLLAKLVRAAGKPSGLNGLAQAFRQKRSVTLRSAAQEWRKTAISAPPPDPAAELVDQAELEQLGDQVAGLDRAALRPKVSPRTPSWTVLREPYGDRRGISAPYFIRPGALATAERRRSYSVTGGAAPE